MNKSIYVAATGQHVGKTTSTLGIISALQKYGFKKVGYCKPVGQEVTELDNLQVDKDAFLFSEIMHFKLSSEIHSPVILGRGATTAFLDNPSAFNYPQRIMEAARMLTENNDIVVFEGTGHPGVGSVVNLSNASVAKMLGAKVVLIVEGGIGNTIDKLSLALAKFNEKQVPVTGVIINKVIPEKLEKVRYYVGKKLDQIGLPMLGVIPFDKSMSNPIMQTIEEAVGGKTLFHKNQLTNPVEDIAPGSLVDELQEWIDRKNLLLVVSYKRAMEALQKLETITSKRPDGSTPISGILLTGEGRTDYPMQVYPLHVNYINRFKLPVISTRFDTLGAFTKISKIEVKINTSTPWKVERAINMIAENVNLDLIVGG